ncbi:hypothetical protein BD289DRAFT_370639 [Coniella lustricola]|uniref:DUF6604 domain-containing protein n=1 Tax=Coniella lustricola TaxID=2025994 RepID=A0A2T3A518_9PEZI|nr:hypothetical protein BD289DRAFT_370639 [Coniella lustricola]
MDRSNRFRGGTWHRYKLGQAQFTRWLKQTADKFTSSAAAEPESTSTTTINHSSKQQQQQQQQQRKKKTAQKAAKSSIDSDVYVHWSELEYMASAIVQNARPEDIPSAPINILRDVIGLRKKSARFFRGNGAPATTDDPSDGSTPEARDKNAAHEHIIQVLERVLAKFETLRAKMPGGGRSTANVPGGSEMESGMSLADLSNMFEHLEVQTSPDAELDDEEENDDSDADAQSYSRTSSSAKSKKGSRRKKSAAKGGRAKKRPQQRDSTVPPGTVHARASRNSSWIDEIDFALGDEDDRDEDFDYYMMIYCFFEDFNTIRSYICERWCDYYFDRSISLNTLAVITNAAFELYHQMEHDLLMDMRRLGIRDPDMGQYEVMMMFIFTETGVEHIDYEEYESLSVKESNERIYKDEWDWLASPAFTQIRHLLINIPPGKTAMICKADRQRAQYGAIKARELDNFKNAVISDLLFDVVCLKALKKNGGAPEVLPAESELLLNFQQALHCYDWCSAFIFSLQLYVDIRNIMEDTVKHPYKQLRATANKIARGLPLQIEWAMGPRYEMRKALRQRQREIDRFMLHDVVLEDKLPRYARMHMEDEVQPFYLLRHEPVWAGLLEFRAKLFMNELGHEYVQRSLVVEAAAFIYEAAQAASPRFPEHGEFPAWTDMDKFLATWTEDCALKQALRNNGKSPNEILQSSQAIISEDINFSAPKPRGVALDAVEGQTEDFKQAVRTRQHLAKRYAQEDRGVHCSLQYMQGLIQQRLERELEGERAAAEEHLSSVLQDISSNKPSAQPHSQGVLNEDQKAMAEERAGLRNQQRAARRRAFLAQLSPLQQIQILEDTVNEQLNGILALDFMNLFYVSWKLLLAFALQVRPEALQKAGCQLGASQGGSVDKLVQIPLLLCDEMAEDPDKKEKVLDLLVKQTKQIVSTSSFEEFGDLVEGDDDQDDEDYGYFMDDDDSDWEDAPTSDEGSG